MKKAPALRPEPRRDVGGLGLLQLGRNARERSVQLCSDAIDDGNDGDRNAGRDEAVFDSGRAVLVTEELKKLGHTVTPLMRRFLASLHLIPVQPPRTRNMEPYTFRRFSP